MTADWVEVLLDLLNTTPVVDGVGTDVLDDDDAARAWLKDHGCDAEGIDVARQVRDDLQRVVRGESDAEVLDRYVAKVRQVPSIHSTGLNWALDGPVAWQARMVLAWGEVENLGPGRLRACANDDCHLFLLDRSRGGTARWCSMSGCGNRMKARRHYRRAAARPGD